MSPLRSHQAPQTAVELYIEKAQVPWYIKTLSCGLVWLVCASFTIFPLAVGDVGPGGASLPLVVFATTLLVIGYAGSIIVCCCVRVRMFQLDYIALPMIGSCAIGILSILFYTFARNGPVAFTIMPLAILITSSTLTIISCVFAWIIHRKINAISTEDRLRRQRGPASDAYNGPGSATSPALPTGMLDEDELLRRQLVMLLQAGADQERNQRRKKFGKKWWKLGFSSTSSAHEALPMNESSSSYVDLLRSTYRIDLPDQNGGQTSVPSSSIRTGSNTYLAVPHNASASSSLRGSPQTSPSKDIFTHTSTYQQDQYQHPTDPSTMQTHYDPVPKSSYDISSAAPMGEPAHNYDRYDPPQPPHHNPPTSLRNVSSTPNLHTFHTYLSSTPPQPTEIHEAPPQKYQRNGWGRTSSPPPRPEAEEQRVKRPEPTPREMRRAEIELGMRRSGV